jgi:hypothetical protein
MRRLKQENPSFLNKLCWKRLQIIDKFLYPAANGKNLRHCRYSRSRDVDRQIVFISQLCYKDKPQIVTYNAVLCGLLDGNETSGAAFIPVAKGTALQIFSSRGVAISENGEA